MVKVTGGGTKLGAVSAHVGYISREGELEIETDVSERITDRDQQKALLKTWHLELTVGQYRRRRSKAESEHGQRLRIDKQMLREWREDFAAMMREQGVSANATSRVVRGRNKRKRQEPLYRARRYGTSTVVQEQVQSIATELKKTGSIRDPARTTLIQTRKALLAHWANIADSLDAQGEVVLAREVRQFAARLPPVLTDRERIATELIRHLKASTLRRRDGPLHAPALDQELTR
jgi:hypothetical protein